MGVAYPTKLAEAFSQKVIEIFFEAPVTDKITNRDYEGEVTGKGSIVNINTFDKISLHEYTGADQSPDALYENPGKLITDVAKNYYFQVKDYDTFRSFIKNPSGPVLTQIQNTLKETVDTDVLEYMYQAAAAGNRVGTDVKTLTNETVTVTTGTGAVAGANTNFTAAMVGRGFKAAGHTKWYRVKSVASTTSMVIEDDKDDVTSAYTGGAIAGGASFEVEAVTPITVTKDTIFGQICNVKTKLDQNRIPLSNRFLVVPSVIHNTLLQAPSSLLSVMPGWDTMKNGYIGHVAGMPLYSNESVKGDATNGYHCLAGSTQATTFAMGLTDSHIEPWVKGNVGMAYFGLNIWGKKVLDERRKALAELFIKV